MPTSANLKSFRALVAIALAIVGAAVIAIGLTVWGLRDDAIAAAARDAGNIATILAEQTGQSVKAIDQALMDVEELTVAIYKAAPERFDEEIGSAEVYRVLTHQLARLPLADVVTIIDRNGRFANTTRSWPRPNVDISENQSFAAVKADRSHGLLVSLPIVSQVSSETIVYFMRRIETPSGEFLAMVVVGVPITYFHHIYNSISSLPDQSFLFLRSDGTVLLRHPDSVDRAGARMPPSSPWYAVIARGGGSYETYGYFDNVARYVAVRQVLGYPLAINVAASKAVSLDVWGRRATMIIAGTLLTLICFILLLRALTTQFHRLSQSQVVLAERESRLSEKSSELQRANMQIDAALNNMSQGLSMCDVAGRVVLFNERFRQIYGFPADVLKPGVPLADLLRHRQSVGDFPDDPERFVATLLADLARGQKVHSGAMLADGRVISVVSEPMSDGGWVATHEDVTERVRSEARIARMARHDALTDIANRVLFREKADEAVTRYEQSGKGFSIFIFDLDLFKSVNDSLGHPVGDALLKAVAQRLRETVGETGTVSRIGGDEFAILQHADGNQRGDAIALANRLLERIGAPYEIDGHRIIIGISIGIAMAPQDGLDTERLLKNADLALYRAKADGRNTYRFFEPDMDAELRLRRALEIDLHNAITNDEFEAYYQPLVKIDTGEICAAEALIRWHHPVHGLVAPDHFISVAEERGLITALGRWMLNRACTDAAKWPSHIRVAVNLSPVQFRNGDLVETVTGALADSGLDPTRLELEITESVLLQKNVRNLYILHQIKNLGVSIVLDDFGTGYSSLSYLRLFPFDKIKIDQSFVREMPDRTDCAAIVCAITSLGRELAMVTTAEGVETEEQLALVRAAGCTQAQGFLFSRPRPVAELDFSDKLVAGSGTFALRKAASG